MNKKFIRVLSIAFVLSLSGCAVVKKISEYRYEYCSIKTDSLTKAAAIQAIRLAAPLYPEDGICVGFEENFYTIER